jgi:hypothetical protein
MLRVLTGISTIRNNTPISDIAISSLRRRRASEASGANPHHRDDHYEREEHSLRLLAPT